MTDNATNDEGLTLSIDQAAEVLHIGVRQVHNHISAGRIRSRKQGHRRILIAEDVYKLADSLDGTRREAQRNAPMVPAIDQLPANVQYLQAELAQLHKHTGQLEEQLKTRLTPEEADELRHRLAETEGRAKAYEEQLAFYRRPWWRKFLGI